MATGRIGAVESLEHMRYIAGWDTDTCITNLDPGAAAVAAQPESNLSFGGCVLERVIEQDKHKLFEPVCVSCDPNGFKGVEREHLAVSKLACGTKSLKHSLIEID